MACFSFIVICIYLYVYIPKYTYIYMYIFLNTTCSVNMPVYMNAFRADHLMSDNLLVNSSLGKMFSQALSSLVAWSSLCRVDISWSSPVHVSMLVAVIFVQIMLRQSCIFPEAVERSCSSGLLVLWGASTLMDYGYINFFPSQSSVKDMCRALPLGHHGLVSWEWTFILTVIKQNLSVFFIIVSMMAFTFLTF